MSAANGRFVWFDLMTPDISGAKSFYSEVVGWQTSKWSGGDYEMWRAGDEEIGGVMGLGPDEGQAPASPQWMAYVGTDDIEGTARRAQELGGNVIVPPREIPSVGRFAIMGDPQGAPIAIFQPATGGMVPDSKKVGHFGWSELNTSDWKTAWKFYSDLFGWQQTSSLDMGPEYGEYIMFGLEPHQPFGGMSNSATLMKTRPHWLYYVNVKSVDDAARKVVEKGGKELSRPMEVPGGGRIIQCLDPQGARFAIFSAPTP